MAELWGQEIDVELRSEPEFPSSFEQLSKKCRRLLIVACQKGRVVKKNGDSHFDSLVEWKVLNPDGTPTDKGQRWYDAQPDI